MAAAEASMKLTCSHGGRLVPCSGAPRYVGGATRVLAVTRAASFRDLAARLSSEMAGGAEVRALRHRLADDAGLEEVLVSVTCDDELAHMRDEYDRLRATRPNAAFRVFIIAATTGGGAHRPRRAAAGLPPLPPKRMRRVQSEAALPARAQLHRCPAYLTPMPRVPSAHEEVAGSRCLLPSFHQHQYCRDVRAPVAAAARPMQAAPHYMSKNTSGVRSGSQERAPTVAAAKAAAGRGVFTVPPHLVCC